MVQWISHEYRWWSFGLHVDFARRTNATTGKRYGPYVDLHLGIAIISVGVNPAHSGELEKVISIGRGGL